MRLTRVVRERLSWAGTAFLVAPGEPGHRVAMARTATYLWAAGAALDVVVLSLPGDPDRDVGRLAILAAAGFCVALFHLAVFDRLPLLGFQLSGVAGSTLIALGTVASHEPAFAFLYLLVIVFSFFFYALGPAAFQAAYAFAAHGLALVAIGSAQQALSKVLLLAGTALVAGVAVALARSRLRTLVGRLGAEARRNRALVEIQHEIALGQLEFRRVLVLGAASALELTGADGAVVELVEGGELVHAGAIADGRSVLETPLTFGGEPAGVLRVLSSRPGAFGERDAETMRLLGGFLGASVTHGRLLERLEESKRRFSEVVQSLDAIVWESEIEPMRSTFVSAGAEKILGYPASRWIDEEGFWERHVHPDDRERVVDETARHVAAGSDHVLDYRMLAADGRVVSFRDVVRAVTDESGRRLLRGVMIDITERLTLEEQLRQSQKMNAVGRLAGGVAHDLNNVLMAIRGYADLLEATADATVAERAGQIGGAAVRGAALTQQLLAFSRRQMLQPRRLDVNEVVEELDDMLRRLITKEIRLERSLDTDLDPVEADPVQIQQVLLNLVMNARDAVAGREGLITIRTSHLRQPEPLVRPDGTIPAGRYVVLEVADTGCGMDAETQAQVFEPFFTTKPPGEGTGLGLATVYGIVKQSGGHVAVDSEPGRGTSFRILLPRHDGPEVPAAAAPERGAAVAEEVRCSVLLVDDDDLVRGVVKEALLEGGYDVLEAESGERALELCDESRPALGAVVTDVVMRGMSGRELVSNLESRYPALKVLYVSGYSDDVLGRDGAVDSSFAFLQKPFSLGDLRLKLDELLAA